jgi:hypothetical protein
LVGHLKESTYLHLGEDFYESEYILSVYPFRKRYPQVDILKLSEEVGHALGLLHFRHGVDAYNFALTYSKDGPYLHLDPISTNLVQPKTTPESIQCFGTILGMSPYVPRADQGPLFDAFCRGYKMEAHEHMREIVQVMKTFLG